MNNDQPIADFLTPEELDFPNYKERKVAKSTRGPIEDSRPTTPLHTVAPNNNPKQIAALASTHRALIDRQDEEGHTPTHIAAACGNLVAINIFFNNGGANPTIKDRSGRTPRQLAEEGRHVYAAHLLEGFEQIYAYMQEPFKYAQAAIDANDRSLVNVAGNAARTPIFEPCLLAGRPELLSKLIEMGADINHIDSFGCTPLHVAVQHDNAESLASFHE